MIAVPNATSFAVSTPGGVDASVGCEWLRWTLTRNCSLSPGATAKAYALLCGVSLAIALGFFALGFRVVLAFCGLELLAVGAAMLVWGRHVGEGEVVTLHADVLRIERRRGTSRARVELPLAWTRVIEEDARVLLACGTRRIEVGAQVGWPLRRRFAQELRRAMTTMSAVPMHAPT